MNDEAYAHDSDGNDLFVYAIDTGFRIAKYLGGKWVVLPSAAGWTVTGSIQKPVIHPPLPPAA
jgi:hypothetical protein